MRIKFLIFGLLLVFSVSAQQQKDSIMSFTLEQAKAYAQENSPTVKNSKLDMISAKKKIWETTAIGLPQVTADYSYSYQVTVNPLIEQFSKQFSSMNGPNANTDSNAFRTSSILDIKVSQIIFSGAYLVGLQTSRIYKGLSELSYTKSRYDLDESVTNAYILVLVSAENKDLMDSTYNNSLSILNSMKKMNQQGLIEETDVEQLQLTTNSLKNAVEMIDRQKAIAERLFKFQLGMDLSAKVELKDSIKGIINNDPNMLLLQEFNYENNTDYKLAETQARLMKMNLNLNKSSFLPNIAAFYQHEKNFNKDAVSFNPADLIGVSVSIPIFSSGQRLAQVSQARISYEKALNSKKQAGDGLILGYEESKSGYISAVDKYNVAKENLKLSESIYNKSLVKYREGMISSIELTQTQNQYIQNESAYYAAIIDLAAARAKFEKILKTAQ